MINFLEETTNNSFSIDWNDLWNQIVSWCTTTGLKFIIALLVLIVVFVIINWTAKGIRASLRKKNKD